MIHSQKRTNTCNLASSQLSNIRTEMCTIYMWFFFLVLISS